MSIIKITDMSVMYRLSKQKIHSLKEYAVNAIKRQIAYEEFWALKNIGFTLEEKDVLGIIGNNGAGKSTLLKIISGIMKPTQGSVCVKGNVVPMLELGSGFDTELSGRENIYLNGSILGYSQSFLDSKYDEVLAFSELGRFIDQPLRNYSSGMMMRLAFSIATVVKPEILIVDEILAVGDESFQKKSRKRMQSLMSGGTTVLFVSHDIEQIRSLCNKVIWLRDGFLEMEGSAISVCDAYQRFNNLEV